MSTDQYAALARSWVSGNTWNGLPSAGARRTLTAEAFGAQTRKPAPDLSGSKLAPRAVVVLGEDCREYMDSLLAWPFSPRPKLSIQTPITDPLHHVRGLDIRRPFQIGDGPRHAQDAVMRPGGQSELLHRV